MAIWRQGETTKGILSADARRYTQIKTNPKTGFWGNQASKAFDLVGVEQRKAFYPPMHADARR
jgi:hypothetical protein